MKILVINCGSSSIKYRMYDMSDETLLSRGVIERIGQKRPQYRYQHGNKERQRGVAIKDHCQAVHLILDSLRSDVPDSKTIDTVGHRVVHGGDERREAVRIDEDVIDRIERFTSLAPLHNRPDLHGIRAAMEILPDVPHVACFDTTFHQTIPPAAYMYAVPTALYEEYGIRKYGFHGISHRIVAERAAKLLGKPLADLNAITCHLGNGCSVTAVQKGRSVDTSMGMTPLDGLVMGTRAGATDPGVLMHLLRRGLSADELCELWNRRSGLLGLSEVSSDMRDVMRAARDGDADAELAVEVFCHRLTIYIGGYLALVGPLDAVVFTGGIGENAPEIRARSCAALAHLGIEIDGRKNAAVVGAEADVAKSGGVRVFVVPACEELAIARAAQRFLRV